MRQISIAICILLLPAAARAGDDTLALARAHLNAGIAYYDEARYDEAAREMEAAYRLRPVAALQYNLAECYDRLSRLDDAVGAYRKYLEGTPGAPDRATVEARISNLEKRASGQSQPAAAPEARTVFKTIVVYRDAPPAPGRAARWAAWGVGVLAAAALASGVATAVLAGQAANTVKHDANTAMPPVFEGKSRDAVERGQTMTAISGVSFGVMAVGVAGAVALYYLGKKIDREAQKREQAWRVDEKGVHF
jgi:tetratricopeptide (TPR) repeat protein